MIGRHVNLSRKFVMGAVALTILPMLIAGAIGLYLGQRGVTTHTALHLRSVVALKSENIMDWLDAQLALASLTVTASGVHDPAQLSNPDSAEAQAAKQRLDQAVRDLHAHASAVQDIALYDGAGQLVYASTVDAPTNGELSLDTGAPTLTFLPPSGDGKGPRLVASAPLLFSSQPKDGFLVVLLESDALKALLAPDPGLGGHGRTYLLTPEIGIVSPLSGHSVDQSEAIHLLAAQKVNDLDLLRFKDDTGTKVVGASTKVGDLQWRVVATLPASDAFRDIRDMRASMLLSVALLGVVGAILAWLFSTTITGPLRAVVAGARAFGAGRLQHRISVRGKDEVGELASSFNQMAQDLTGLYEALARERSTLAAVQESMTEGLVVLDASDSVRYCNVAAYYLWGMKPGDVVGKSFDVVLEHLDHRLENPESANALQGAIAAAKEGKAKAVEVHLLGGRVILVAPFTILASAEESLTGLLLRDVSEERDLERRRDAFVSVASHEMRTPLTTIVGFAELLRDREPPPDTRVAWLDHMIADGNRLAAIVDDMLNVSRIQSGRITVNLQPLSLTDVAERVVAIIQPTITNHTLLVRIPPMLPLVSADEEKLLQVLINLVSNAVKYSPKGGEVAITAAIEPSQREVIVSVADQGMGISREDQARLFTSFTRIRTPETQGIRGTGLGLYIVKGLVELMQGRIWLESNLGKGSVFSFSLPIASPASESLQSGEMSESQGDSRSSNPGAVGKTTSLSVGLAHTGVALV
ncbi:MAG: HAMP domain-containing protein [Chloroflexi bacterium]|nr:HAMP domain-containing protein [Chloroflexota bacterium]